MILAFDPGMSKTGWAFSDSGGRLLLSGISRSVEMRDFPAIVKEGAWDRLDPNVLEGDRARLSSQSLPLLLIGDGTGCRVITELFEEVGLSIQPVEEAFSTLRARALYWRLYPPKGWRRFLPLALQVPPRDLDDLAAWAIILSFLDRWE